ncbi:hypothetical protein BH10BAC6_BH10BAC6_06550 [soil metagenome]
MRLDDLYKQLTHECATSVKMLERVPADNLDFRPHERSMVMRSLATHVAELPSWVTMTLTSHELDFVTMPYTPPTITSVADLLNVLDASLRSATATLAATAEESLDEQWTLRSGEVIHLVTTKFEMVQSTISQIIHHRAQLGVYLRLLDIPIPGSYGPSADEPM